MAELDLPIEWLPAEGPAEQLIVLLHGWGDDAQAMAPLAQALRREFPQAALLAPDAPAPCDRIDKRSGVRGRQWWSIEDINAENGRERVQGAATLLLPWLRAQQRRLGVGEAATALAGFSQGAIVALALVTTHDGLAGRVLAFGGKFGPWPLAAPALTTLHFFHGADDAVFPAAEARAAFRRIGELHGDATLDIAEGVGHVLHPALIDCALHRLKNHIPLRTWQAALGAVPQEPLTR
jgi:phospholipase/carboxylesterase